MTEDVSEIISSTRDSMKKALSFLEGELAKIRAGKASTAMLDGIMVDYYGSPTPLNQIANVTIMDARTITLQPWEKKSLQPIERAIIAANIGVNPQNDGNLIRLFLPPLTEERRKEFVKKSNNEGEQAKIAIRSIRRDSNDQIKKLQKEGLSEDAARNAESELQEITNNFISMIDRYLETKEKEIMAV